MPKMNHVLLDVAVIQLTEPASIHEMPSYIARCEVGGVSVIGNRAESALGAAQSLFYILTGAGGTEKAQDASVGLSLAVAGTDMQAVDDELRNEPVDPNLFKLEKPKDPVVDADEVED